MFRYAFKAESVALVSLKVPSGKGAFVNLSTTYPPLCVCVSLPQEMTSKKSVYESGSLALRYKLDNEFELVFIAAYQKVLPLFYLDKLLDEIQLRFRDRFQHDLKVGWGRKHFLSFHLHFIMYIYMYISLFFFRRTIFFARSPPLRLTSTGR